MKKRKNKRRRKIKTQEKIKVLVPVIMLWCFIIVAGYFLFCQIWEIPEVAQTFSQDGYYEIDSAEDFYLFWDKVCIDDKYACGRLTKDIYLNNISGDMELEKWKKLHPYEEVEVFSGIFDGNGHTVYGLYSDKGYGLAVRNTGEIRNLSIRESVVYGVRSVGGICRGNDGVISGCTFDGKLCTTVAANGQLSGICSWNWGTIEECGFLGTIDVDGEYFDGKVSGICMENRGEILHCYNLADLNERSWQPWQPKRFPAITNQGEKQCFAIKDSGWDFPESGQTAALEWQQAAYIPLLIHGNPYGMLVKDKKFGEKQEPQEILNDEVVLDLIMEVIIAKGEKCDDLSMETEVLGDSAFLTLSDGADEIAISVYPAWQEEAGEQEAETSEKFENFEGLWQQCAEKLGEKDAESFEHSSWQMVVGQEGKETVFGNFVLFRTDEGRQGFFLQKDQRLYRIECRKNQAEASEMYEVMLRELWDGKTPSVGISWKSEEIRKASLAELEEIRVKQEVEAEQTEDLERAVDSEQGNRKKEVWETIPSREELYALETLSIYGVEQINSLEDLTKMPHLKRISINGEFSYVNFDLKKGMVPELETLWIRSVQLENLDFLERFPQLKSLTVCYCGLEDISGIRYQKELTEVNLSNNVIQNIWPLRNCKNLEGISLNDNQVEDISVLMLLPKLKTIDISFNEFISIEPLQWLGNLECLVCRGNELQNIDALKYLTKLQFLSLANNQIEDFEPITGLTGLYYLDIYDNPGQKIGDLIFVPKLFLGNGVLSQKEEKLREAQNILESFYPNKGLTAKDMVEGDLNGDGILDIAIAVLKEGKSFFEPDVYGKIYIFLGRANKVIQQLTPIDMFDPGYEGHYDGMLIMERGLVVRVEYSSTSGEDTYISIYEYEEGEMREKWKLEAGKDYSDHKPGFDFWITDIENQNEKHYVIVEGEWLLFEEENENIPYAEEDGTFVTE
ncbi:MAG: leucine-rich repeat domain-containing protein [Lachnospiraceae bacterium]|nr:leucine-rich repeat domain-containing protein [Lachnospiraceae bacterium]